MIFYLIVLALCILCHRLRKNTGNFRVCPNTFDLDTEAVLFSQNRKQYLRLKKYIHITFNLIRKLCVCCVITNLHGVTGGGLLGNQLTATITIAKSDYPNGAFGFTSDAMISVENPEFVTAVRLAVIRIGGLLGQQTVSC